MLPSPQSPRSVPNSPSSGSSGRTSGASSQRGASRWCDAELRGHLDARMGWYIIVGTIPIGIAGFLLEDTIQTAFRNLWLIAVNLILFGLILGVADRLARAVLPIERLEPA